MASLISGFGFAVHVSYHHNENMHDIHINEFTVNLKRESEATFREDISDYAV